MQEQLAQASHAYERDRYQDALRLLASIHKAAPSTGAVAELHGLTLYRLGRWREAARKLESFSAQTGSVEQLPVVADCFRALGRHREVEATWDQLRRASPGVEVLAEGRLVVAGDRADRGEVGSAIALLQPVSRQVRHPRLHHLRQWYALADLYERTGEIPKARQLFATVYRHDPNAFDVAERLAALS